MVPKRPVDARGFCRRRCALAEALCAVFGDGIKVDLKPGGMHLMLINPKRAYAVNDRIRFVLRLQGGEQVEASAVVRRRKQGQPEQHHQDHGDHR